MGTRRQRPGRNAHRREIEELKARLAETEETLRAIREGEVDAVVVSGSKGDQVFSLIGAESIYRLIVETMKEAVFTASFDGRILYCNAQLSEFVRTPMAEILGRRLEEFVAPDSKSATDLLLSEARERPVKTRLMFKASDESLVPAHVSANVLRQVDELSICIVASDLTELENSTELIQKLRRQQEELKSSNEELIRSESKFRALFESSPDAVFIATFNGMIAAANPAACEMFGMAEAELLRGGYQGISVLDDPEGFAAFDELGRTGRLIKRELTFIRKNGEKLTAEVDAAVMPNNRDYAFVILRDITERKRAEEALRQAHDTLAAVIEAAPAGVIVCDSAGQILLFSNGAKEIVGGQVSGSVCETSAFYEVRQPHGTPMPGPGSPLLSALNGTPVADYEAMIKRHDGVEVTILANATPLRDEEGRIWGAVSVFQDITERKRIEEELKRSRTELELHVKERTRELSQTVRTLNQESAQRLFAEEFLSKRSEQLHRMTVELALTEQRERQRLAQVLHDGLQQTLVGAKYRVALVARNHELRPDLDQIAKLLDDAIDTSRSLSAELSPPILLKGDLLAALEWLARWMKEKHDLAAVLTSCNSIPSLNQGMLLMLFQAARELLFNIVKHAGVRKARIELDRHQDQILMTVADEGAGFDVTLLDSDEGHPHGIGLFGVRERLSYIGGVMEIDSAPGKGSRFTLIVPISATVAESVAESAPSISPPLTFRPEPAIERGRDAEKIRIMLVDDHMVVRQGLAGLLRCESDIEIVGEASNGMAAVELARRVRPDVILMDISMPVMDGVQATRIIHSEFPEIRIMGLSTFREDEQRIAMRDAGAADYLFKSGPSEALIEGIRSCAAAKKRLHGAEDLSQPRS